MSLIYNLGTKVQGDKLAKVVEASMQEIDGWKFEKGKNAGAVEFYRHIDTKLFREYRFGYIPIKGTFNVPFVSYKCSKNNKGSIIFSLKKERRKLVSKSDVFDFWAFAAYIVPFSAGLAIPSVIEMYQGAISMPTFASHDTIFTFINKKETYSCLEFYANAAFDINKIEESGQVQESNSPPFVKVQPTYNQLVQQITSRLPRQSPYRTLPNLL